MVYLTALLPVPQGVAVYAALRQAAATAVGVGEAMSTGQAMADELVRRTTGASSPTGLRVALNLTMTAEALLAHSDDPATLADFGPVPADLARELIANACDAGHEVWLKRLFAAPGTGALIGMDSRARLFPKTLAEFIGLRDRFCRNPWCDAPIRHRDHVVAHEDGGPTSAENGQGLCEACNYTKQATGWQARPSPGDRHTVTVTTPTGHQYRSTAPAA